MLSEIFEVSDSIKNQRTLQDILAHAMEEMGELATEVNIRAGKSYKPSGKDGIVGEAVDVMLCVLDLVHVSDPSITPEKINQLVSQKLAKWIFTTG